MKLNLMILTAFALHGIEATAITIPAELLSARAIEGADLPYPVATMQWKGSIEGGARLSFNGSIQEVVSHLQKTQPKFDLAKLVASTKDKRSLNPRTPIWQTCYPDPDQPYANMYAGIFGTIRPIEDAIGYLKAVGGTCGCAAHSCCRISCSYNDAVWLCNDNNFQLNPLCDYQGYEMVQWVQNNCAGRDAGHRDQIKGKTGDSQLYTVTVQGNGNC